MKKLKWLLPTLLGIVAVASIAPIVVSCSSNDDSSTPQAPQMELIPVDNQDQVWTKVEPLIQEYYTPDKIIEDIKSYAEQCAKDYGDTITDLLVNVEKTNPNDKNTTGTYNITLNISSSKWTLNQKGFNVEVKPILIKDETFNKPWTGITKVCYLVQMIEPFTQFDSSTDFVQQKPDNKFIIEIENQGYLKPDMKLIKPWVAGIVYTNFEDAYSKCVDTSDDPSQNKLPGFIMESKSLPISTKQNLNNNK